MQCIILAAGEGTRMRPLTHERPKPLIAVAGRPLIAHVVSALPREIDEIVIVIGYKGEMIREYCGDVFLNRPVTYVTQANQKAGTADALAVARDILHDRFLVMYADDIHGAPALQKVVQHEHAMVVAYAEHPERFGVVEQHEDGTLKRIVEKPAQPLSHRISTGGFVLSTEIFDCVSEQSVLGEYILVDNINIYASRHPVVVVEQTMWIPVGYPEDIEKAEVLLRE